MEAPSFLVPVRTKFLYFSIMALVSIAISTTSVLIYDKVSCYFISLFSYYSIRSFMFKNVQVGKDQEKAQSEKDSHSKNRGGKKPN